MNDNNGSDVVVDNAEFHDNCNPHGHSQGCPEEQDEAAEEAGHVPGANETEGVSA